MAKVSFTESVGVAPGTTTMQLGNGALRCAQLGEGCPPDPVRYYTDPPRVESGWNPIVTAKSLNGEMAVYNPYGTESQLKSVALAGLRGLKHGLRGLRGLGEARLGVAVIAAALAFAGVLGYGVWKRRH